MNAVLDIIQDSTLTYEQRLHALALEAENSLNVLKISQETQNYRDSGVICDLFEGNAPYRPRYILPDYELLMKQGCRFLDLDPPKDIWEATNYLLILYKHVPSITTFPVYIGNLDTLLEPFVEDEAEAYKAILLFFKQIDRTIGDSFCHGNIGPDDSVAGRLILKAQRELETSIPNITLKFDQSCSDNFAVDAINTALITAKPSFANHEMFSEDLSNYGIASCYNGLKIGGGSHTLVRLNLGRLEDQIIGKDHFLKELLPNIVSNMLSYLDERVRFVVEESGFFEGHFLVEEGFISKSNFTAMFGLVGLAECANLILEKEGKSDRFGHSEVADQLGLSIIEHIDQQINSHHNSYLAGSGGKYLLHGQVGLDSDVSISPGCRIPVGEEPPLHQHLHQSAPFHKFFPSGIGDVFRFDDSFKRNPEAILDMIKGAFRSGLRYISLYGDDCDVVRITGYLVKRSDIEKLKKGGPVLNDAVVLGMNTAENNQVLERKLRSDDQSPDQ
ncbi:MAG: YjjI family glycine radical enzyme [Proteobacteria bacterium]|nr:YjjI family glycine radical enzyme [Pseudomonadota bacterium]